MMVKKIRAQVIRMQSRNVEFIEVSVPVSDFYDLEGSMKTHHFRLAMGPWTVHRKSRMFRTSFGCHFDEDEALFLEEVIVPAKQYGMDRVAEDTR